MPYLDFMSFFKKRFEEFCDEKSISNSPTFGLCYKGRNSKYLQIDDSSQNLRKIIPIVHKLSSQEDDLNDLKFLSNLDSKLKRFLGSELIGKYNLETGLITIPIPLNQFNQPEESKNELPTLIYAFAGITKEFYENVTNKIKEKKMLDNIGAYIIFWSLKDEKDPLEVIFNYHLEESPNELLRTVKGKDLEKFIGDYDLINTG